MTTKEAQRWTASVFPSEGDDVITSPYNAVLSLASLAEHADLVIPMQNDALGDVLSRLPHGGKPKGALKAAAATSLVEPAGDCILTYEMIPRPVVSGPLLQSARFSCVSAVGRTSNARFRRTFVEERE